MKLKLNYLNQIPKLLLLLAVSFGLPDRATAIDFAGKASGEWSLPPNADPQYTFITDRNGGENNRMSWGEASTDNFSSYVQFDGVNFSTETNKLFDLGTLTYRNGTTYVDSNFDGDFSLSLNLSFTLPVVNQQTFSFLFNILNTPNNTGNPVLDGDRLRFSTAGISSQTFEYEGNDYTLQLMGFSTDGGSTIVQEFNSPEGETASAFLYGKIIAAVPVSIPEPVSLVSLSLLGVYFAVRKLN